MRLRLSCERASKQSRVASCEPASETGRNPTAAAVFCVLASEKRREEKAHCERPTRLPSMEVATLELALECGCDCCCNRTRATGLGRPIKQRRRERETRPRVNWTVCCAVSILAGCVRFEQVGAVESPWGLHRHKDTQTHTD